MWRSSVIDKMQKFPHGIGIPSVTNGRSKGQSVQCDMIEVEKTIRELHSYDVPEILAVKVKTGFGDYLRWVHDGVK